MTICCEIAGCGNCAVAMATMRNYGRLNTWWSGNLCGEHLLEAVARIRGADQLTATSPEDPNAPAILARESVDRMNGVFRAARERA